DAAALVDAIGRTRASDRADAVLWPDGGAPRVMESNRFLESLGYIHAALNVVDGELSLDAPSESWNGVAMVAMTEAFFASLGGDVSADASGASELTISASASDTLPDVFTRQAPIARTIGLDWELRSDSGWGVYGTNLTAALARRGDIMPAIFLGDLRDTSPVIRRALEPISHAASARAAVMNRTPAVPFAFDGVMLRALSNNMIPGPLWTRVQAQRNAGVIFFEDTHFDANAIARANALDLIVTGSSWNEEVLRAQKIQHVVTVLQGIDPTVFHPAPRSGFLGDRFVVFSGGKLEYRKGQDIVAASFRAFHQRHPEALLVAAWHNNWPQLISDLDLAGHVTGHPLLADGELQLTDWLGANGIPRDAVLDIGRLPNAMMGQLVREADVALFPNRCEGGTNLVAMECMACGVPTIVSNNTGHRDLVATGGCIPLKQQGTVTPPSRFFRGIDGWGESSVDEIVATLERIYDDRAVAASIAQRGADALAAMSWRAQTDRFIDAIQPLFS
ncbi:MAG: glycosyltransferase family 4 protein, partial [Gemmatimonadaceae bacterium]